jgi:hypothetical protein
MKTFKNLLFACALLVGAAMVVEGQVFYTTKVCADAAFTQCHTVPAVASDTVSLIGATQTLSGKTLSTPAVTGVATMTTDSIGATWSNQLLMRNTTAATNVLNQWSPTFKFSGQGWNTTTLASQTVSGEVYVVPTNANPVVPVLNFDTLDGNNTRTTVMGISPANVSFGGSITASAGTVTAAAGGAFILNGRTRLQSGADGRLTVNNNAASSGLEFTFGATPTVSSCGAGTITAGSRNSAGEITATGVTSCTVTFASPTFNNPPFCTANNHTTAAPVVVTVSTTVSVTLANLTAGDKVFYMCIGRF